MSRHVGVLLAFSLYLCCVAAEIAWVAWSAGNGLPR